MPANPSSGCHRLLCAAAIVVLLAWGLLLVLLYNYKSTFVLVFGTEHAIEVKKMHLMTKHIDETCRGATTLRTALLQLTVTDSGRLSSRQGMSCRAMQCCEYSIILMNRTSIIRKLDYSDKKWRGQTCPSYQGDTVLVLWRKCDGNKKITRDRAKLTI